MLEAPSFDTWEKRGKYIEILGHRLFVIDEGDHEETIAILHGYPSCSYDYYSVLPLLTKHFRVVVHDHPGFGLSEKKWEYSYSLFEQADTAQALWQHLGLDEVHLLAHDYGTSVATEIIARKNLGYEPIRLKSITIGNGSMLINMAQLIWTQKALRHHFWGPILAKLTNKPLFINNFRKLWHDKSKIDMKEFDVLWKMLGHNNGFKTLPVVSRYLHERQKFWHRWIGGLERVDQHVHIIWADKDPVAIFDMALVLEKKIKDNTLTVLKDIGHYPMLEDPDAYSQAVLAGCMK